MVEIYLELVKNHVLEYYVRDIFCPGYIGSYQDNHKTQYTSITIVQKHFPIIVCDLHQISDFATSLPTKSVKTNTYIIHCPIIFCKTKMFPQFSRTTYNFMTTIVC